MRSTLGAWILPASYLRPSVARARDMAQFQAGHFTEVCLDWLQRIIRG